MADSTSILLQENVTSELNIQQPLHINGYHAKLIATEHKLNQVFEEYTGRIESFMLILDMLHEAVFLLNKAGEICYANGTGSLFIKESATPLPGYLSYRDLAHEETVVLDDSTNPDSSIRISNFVWNNEACNLFIIEKRGPAKQLPDIQPVVTIGPFGPLMNYLNLIAGHEANGRASEAADCAELASKTITESENLLGDVKTFIRLANHQPVLSQVSMQRVVGDVLKSMGAEIEDAEVELTVSELPESSADKELIIILLKHLIGNALKFRNKGRKATIDVGYDKGDGQFIFCIRDNGIGISKKHHEEVFNLFFSLNDASEYPGNGMGLAICKKIVELHQGKIWVESLPGHGSNFYFKLNAKQ